MKKIAVILMVIVLLTGCTPVEEVSETALTTSLSLIVAGDTVKLTNKLYTEDLENVCTLTSGLAGSEKVGVSLSDAVKDIVASPGVQLANVEVMSGNVVDKNTVVFDVKVTAADTLGATVLKTIDMVNAELEKEIDIPGFEPIKLDRPDMSVPIKGPSVDVGLFNLQLPDSEVDLGSSFNGMFDDIEKWSNDLAKDAHDMAVQRAIEQKEKDIETAYNGARANAYADIASFKPVPYRTVDTQITMKKIDGMWKMNLDVPLACALLGFNQSENYGYSMVNGRLVIDSYEHSWEIR